MARILEGRWGKEPKPEGERSPNGVVNKVPDPKDPTKFVYRYHPKIIEKIIEGLEIDQNLKSLELLSLHNALHTDKNVDKNEDDIAEEIGKSTKEDWKADPNKYSAVIIFLKIRNQERGFYGD